MARGQLILKADVDETASDDLSEKFAALGLQCEPDFVIDQDEFWLWPENEAAWWLWHGLQTQWVVGMAGAFGLNYAGVEADMRMLCVPKKKRREYYVLIKHMEQAALDEWASK